MNEIRACASLGRLEHFARAVEGGARAGVQPRLRASFVLLDAYLRAFHAPRWAESEQKFAELRDGWEAKAAAW